MQINFFEEFPDGLDKLKLYKPPKLFVAAKSLSEFKEIKNKVKLIIKQNKSIRTKSKQKTETELIYWPILSIKEGYWISPFSNRQALLRIFNELKNKNISVMLDLELPTTKNPKLYFTQFTNFYINRRLIKNFINNYSGKVCAAEYNFSNQNLLKKLGLHFNNTKIIKMKYHSLHSFNKNKFKSFLNNSKQKGIIPGLGTIAKGINGNEKILSPLEFKRDLKMCKESGIKEVVIFRLGGLNKKYLDVINKI